MITMYFHCLDMTPGDEKFVADSLKELAQHLKAEPIRLQMSIERLGNEPELAKEVIGELNKPNDRSCGFSDYAAVISDILACHVGVGQPSTHTRLLVYCRRDSQVAKAAIRQKPSAQWGAICRSFAAVYSPGNKFIIWHELVHLLLGRDDDLDECYEPYHPYPKKGDCDCETCLMQYAPSEETVGDWPSLCSKVIKLLQDRRSEVQGTT